MKSLGYFAVVFFFLTSCSLLKPVPKNANIKFERTACYGTCPIYKMHIDYTGKVTFVGERFTKKLGTWEKQLNKSEINSLFNLFKEVGWDSISNDYPAHITDLPSVIIHFTHRKIDKEVVITGDHPEILDKLKTRLNNIAESEDWTNLNVN